MMYLTSLLHYVYAAIVLCLCVLDTTSYSTLAATQTFSYTGGPQTYVVPDEVVGIEVTAVGASGGNYEGMYTGGYGAQITATIEVSPGDTIYIYVGGQGGSNYNTYSYYTYGGYNGGGTGVFCGGGGGSTDIRVGGSSIDDRVIVAGGGGASCDLDGGAGGTPDGGTPSYEGNIAPNAGYGATQTSAGQGCDAGSFYYGGNVSTSADINGGAGAGGGGGWYGGGAGCTYDSGGGGSSYATSATVTYTANVGTGDGYVTFLLITAPTSMPSSSPSVSPSTSPSAQPSAMPWAFPSSQPSDSPSNDPSGQPSGCPSFSPTTSPSSQPSSAPTTEPSSQPSAQPWGMPTSFPSEGPSSRPSGQPTSYPSKIPSMAPSSQPTALPSVYCGPGTYQKVNSAGDTIACIACPTGLYSSSSHADSCSVCPAGSYTSNPAECLLCPVNSYSTADGSTSCTKCGPGEFNAGDGNTKASSCHNASYNFAVAFLCLFLCALGIYLYIFEGRLMLIAYCRKFLLVKKYMQIYDMLYRQLLIIEQLSRHIRSKLTKAEKRRGSRISRVLFGGLTVILAGIITIVFTFLGSVIKFFFLTVILWRGYRVYFDLAFLDNLSAEIERLNVPFLDYIAYPFIWIIEQLAKLSIDLSAVGVTCGGAQAPIALMIDLVILAVIVIVIQSDLFVYFYTSFLRAHSELRTAVFFQSFWSSSWSRMLYYLTWSCVCVLLPSPIIILQYVLGFLQVWTFFRYNGYSASGKYSSCGDVDKLLADLTTIFCYFLILPVAYLLSQCVVPTFVLPSGTVPHIRYEPFASERLCRCNVCRGELFLFHTAGVKCSKCGCEGERVGGLDSKYYKMYSCSTAYQCQWILCGTCCEGVITSDNNEKVEKQDDRESSAKHECHVGLSVFDSFQSWIMRLPVLTNYGWFYIWRTYKFAKSIMAPKQGLDAMKSHIFEKHAEKLKEINIADTENRSEVHLLPGFFTTLYSMRCNWYKLLCVNIGSQEDIQASAELQRSWHLLDSIPSYSRLVSAVCEDTTYFWKGSTSLVCKRCEQPIIGKHFECRNCADFILCKNCCRCTGISSNKPIGSALSVIMEQGLSVLSWMAASHVFSIRGREIWHRVIKNYGTYLTVASGVWVTPNVEKFDLKIKSFQRQEELWFCKESDNESENLAYRSFLTHGPGKLLFQNLHMTLVSSVVAPRVTLLQVFPYCTLLSTIAVAISECPIFVYDSFLLNELPPFILWNNLETDAKKYLECLNVDPLWWNVQMMSVYLFYENSRVVQFSIKIIENFMAVALVLDKNNNTGTIILAVMLLFYLILATVNSLFYLVLAYRFVFPRSNRNAIDSRDALKSDDSVKSLQLERSRWSDCCWRKTQTSGRGAIELDQDLATTNKMHS